MLGFLFALLFGNPKPPPEEDKRAMIADARRRHEARTLREIKLAEKVRMRLKRGKLNFAQAFRKCEEAKNEPLLKQLAPLCRPGNLIWIIENEIFLQWCLRNWPSEFAEPNLFEVHDFAIQNYHGRGGRLKRADYEILYNIARERLNMLVPHDPVMQVHQWQKGWAEYRITRLNTARAKKPCPNCTHFDERGNWVYCREGKITVYYLYRILCTKCGERIGEHEIAKAHFDYDMSFQPGNGHCGIA
jgi:hypothetical protein